jgi:hypothetical protein
MQYFVSSPLWWPDPGPCPVDDAPHTTCTSPDHGQSSSIVVQQMPMRDLTARPTPPPPVEATVETFSTKTYRRKRK